MPIKSVSQFWSETSGRVTGLSPWAWGVIKRLRIILLTSRFLTNCALPYPSLYPVEHRSGCVVIVLMTDLR